MIELSILNQIGAVAWHQKLSPGDPGIPVWGIATGPESDTVLSRSAHAVQVHGRTVLPATAVVNPTRPEADGIFSTSVDQVVAVKTADCLPLLFSAKKNQGPFAMAIHAGWRGFCAGIIGEGIRQANGQGMKPEGMRVVIGPAICAHHFEIGPEVVEALTRHSGSTQAANFISKGKGDRWHADLQTAAVVDLLESGFSPGDIEVVRVCTFESDLPSYRREGKGCGRLVSWVRCVDPARIPG
jgi:YfiH family protein